MYNSINKHIYVFVYTVYINIHTAYSVNIMLFVRMFSGLDIWYWRLSFALRTQWLSAVFCLGLQPPGCSPSTYVPHSIVVLVQLMMGTTWWLDFMDIASDILENTLSQQPSLFSGSYNLSTPLPKWSLSFRSGSYIVYASVGSGLYNSSFDLWFSVWPPFVAKWNCLSGGWGLHLLVSLRKVIKMYLGIMLVK